MRIGPQRTEQPGDVPPHRPPSPRAAVRGLRAAVLALALLPVPSSAQHGGETLMDRVAVVVEGPTARDRQAEIATLFDLYVAANVQLIRRAGPDAPSLPIDAPAIRDAQRQAVEDLIALREAVRLGRDAISPGLVDEARDALAERIGGHEALRAFLRDRAVSMEAVDETLRDGVIVERFTRDSVRLPAALDADDLQAMFEAGGHPFVGRDFAEAAPEYEAWVRQQQFADSRRLWLTDLRSHCRLALFDVAGDMAAPAAGIE